MKRFEPKILLMLTLPSLAFLFLVFICSNVGNSESEFRVSKHEIAWETESPAGITGNIQSMRFKKVFCHRIVLNYPTLPLARWRPGLSLRFLELRAPIPHPLSFKTICIDGRGRVVPSYQHIELDEMGRISSETEYVSKVLRSAKGPISFHVQLQWNNSSKIINLPTQTISSTVLKTNEGFSLDLN